MHYNRFDAEIISELINSGDYQKIQATKLQNAKKCNTIYNAIFGATEEHTNPYSFYRWLNIGISNQTLIQKLHTKNIAVMESQLFNAGTQNADHYIRIALSSEKDICVLQTALQTIYNTQNLLHKI